MRALTIFNTSLCLALFSYFRLASAAVLRDSPRAQSSENIRSVDKHKRQTALKNTAIVPQAITAAPDETKGLTWKTHALPKGNWIFTRYGINGTYPDDYP